jgi:hypothetical protein
MGCTLQDGAVILVTALLIVTTLDLSGLTDSFYHQLYGVFLNGFEHNKI